MQNTQAEWERWAEQRVENAQKVASTYQRQAQMVRRVVAEKGCACDPMIAFGEGEFGGPSGNEVHVTHTLLCNGGGN